MMTTTKRDFNLLIGCTGSVAALKIPLLIREIYGRAKDAELDVTIRLVPTERSTHFFDVEEVKSPSPDGKIVRVFTDEDEWKTWTQRGDAVLHIELRRWADAMLIAPLDANTLAKLATGICDNLLTCVVRAWDLKAKKPLIFAPAMNTCMYEHPLTGEQVDKLKSFGYDEISPIEKVLVCGDKGTGAMENCERIAKIVVDKLFSWGNDE